jgi:uncharacterized protein (TIGR03000 family)
VNSYGPGVGLGYATTQPVSYPTVARTTPSISGSGAKLTVELPDDAKLYVDDHQMKTTSGKRVFRTPSLEMGRAYYYVLRAEVVRYGKVYSQNKRVIVRSGEDVKASFADLVNDTTTEALTSAR